jgi:hypothetical protein
LNSIGDVIVVLLGGVVFIALLLVAMLAIARAARSAGVLAPVIVGGLVRLGVMVVVHLGSLELGDGGLMFLDDRTYFETGRRLADAWRAGDIIDPGRYEYAGTPQFGYSALVGAVFVLVGPSIFAAKLVNVIAATATVLLVALLAGRILGEELRRPAAWLAALFPGLVWWSAPLMKEAFVTFLVMAALLAAAHLPKRSAAVVLIPILGALVLTRTAAALAIALGIGAALAFAAWKSTGFGLRLSLPLAGGVTVILLVGGLLLARGDPRGLVLEYLSTIERMIDQYQGSAPTRVPVDVLKSLVTPFPWVFDLATRNWDRGLYPGVWVLYLLYPLAAAGIWRLRHRPELLLILVPVVSSLVMNAFTSGFVFRQRSPVEPVILVLALAGITSYRQAARWGAAALAAVACVATVQSDSTVTGTLIATAAAGIWVAAMRLPGHRLPEPRSSSPLAESLATFTPPTAADTWRQVHAAVARLRALAPPGPVDSSSNRASHRRPPPPTRASAAASAALRSLRRRRPPTGGDR